MRWLARMLVGFSLASGGMYAASLPIRIYTTGQGLPHEHVNHVYRDSRGFLWICTDEGLSRFDGQHFVNYTVASGLPHMHVNEMLETRAGEYWIATDGGAARFHPDGQPRRFVTFTPPGPPESRRVNALAEDRDRSIWLGTSAGLYRLRPQAGEPKFERELVNFPTDLPEASTVTSLHLDHSGVLWAGSVSGLYRRDLAGKWKRFLIGASPHIFINSIVEDPQGQLWICTRQHGFGRWAGSNGDQAILDQHLEIRNGLPDQDVRGLLFGSGGRRWAATSSGLVDWSNPRLLKILTTRDGLSDDSIYALTEDPTGNLWVGTRRGGVMRMGPADWKTFDHSDGLELGPDETLLETLAGEICIADLSDGRRPLRCLNGDRFDEIFPSLPRAVLADANSSEMVMPDREGSLWISTGQGAFRFAGAVKARELAQAHAQQVTPNTQTTRMFEDSRGDIWIATFSSQNTGLLRWDHSSGSIRHDSPAWPAQFAGARISALAEEPPGQLWIGLAHGGVLLRSRNGRFEPVQSPLEGRISQLFVDHSGRLWIGSLEGGLGRVNDPGAAVPLVEVFTSSRNLSSNEIWSLVEDNFGRIYAGTARGVDRIDPKTDDILHYTVDDGLAQGDIRSALRGRNGDLWFLSNRGASRFRPGPDVRLASSGSRITALRIAGTPWPISELGETHVGPLQLSYLQNSLAVEFGSIDYRTPPRTLFQYRLEGAAGAWSTPTADGSVSFANLAPGRYRFVVRNTFADGRDASEAALRFTILPPIWRRWWFQGLMALVAAAIVYFLHRMQLERRLALERVRTDIAMDLHDDLGASLARMAVIGEVVKTNVSQNDLESQLMLNDIAETSRRLVEGMSDIVWSIDPRHERAGDTISRLRDFASPILEAKGIRWQLEAAPHVSSAKLSAEQRRQLYLVCKEAIHNIARHSKARHAFVRLGVEHGMFRAEIEDDGCGIPSDDHPGLGMRSMRARAAQLGGTLYVSPGPAQGMRVTLRFPLRSKNA